MHSYITFQNDLICSFQYIWKFLGSFDVLYVFKSILDIAISWHAINYYLLFILQAYKKPNTI